MVPTQSHTLCNSKVQFICPDNCEQFLKKAFIFAEIANDGITSSSRSPLFGGNEVTEKIESLGQSRSELTLHLTPADHGATYRCRSFASPTMTRPIDTDESVIFNITCKFICVFAFYRGLALQSSGLVIVYCVFIVSNRSSRCRRAV